MEDTPNKASTSTSGNQEREAGASGGSSKQSISSRARDFLTWTLNDVFDFNPDYPKSVRGILNICHIILGMFIVALIGSACQMQPYIDPKTVGFYCKTSDTFMFVMGCSSFINSILFLACCLLSKKTDKLLFSTSYEFVYYVTYAVFFCIGSLSLTSNVAKSGGKDHYEQKYQVTLSGGVFGILISIAYTVSAVWFVIYHKKYDSAGGGESRTRNAPNENI